MFRALRPLALLCTLWVLPAMAQEDRDDQWAVSPELRAAALAWLAADDPTEALWQIGTYAAQGDIPARFMARTLYYNFVAWDFPDLDRDGWAALFPPDPGEASRFWRPYPIDEEAVPAAAARNLISHAETAEDWIAQAQVLLDAGLTNTVREHLRILLGNGSPFAGEAAMFMEGWITPEDALWFEIWYTRATDHGLADTFEEFDPERSQARRDQWGGTPWGPAQNAQFDEALADGRWTALRAFALLSLFDDEGVVLPMDAPPPELERWARQLGAVTVNDPERAPPLTADDLAGIGALVRTDAARSPYLTPLKTACDTACPDTTTECLAIGAITRVYDISRLRQVDFGPALPLETYASSDRAGRDLLAHMGALYSRDRTFALDMPQCFRDAALALNPTRDTE